MTETIVIAGAGEAGCQTALSLRELGFDGRVVLVGEEPCPPYQRPPLSKEYLAGTASEEALWLRPTGYYAEHDIELWLGERVESIDRDARKTRLGSGEVLGYDHLVLALGARNRALPIPGAGLDGVASLRTVRDAARLREQMDRVTEVVVVGGGFVGLEVAATAARSGRRVTVVEVADRVMGRVVSPRTSEFLLASHRSAGVHIELGVAVAEIEGERGGVTGVRLSDGRRVPAHLVVVGVGAVPNVEPALQAGLPAKNGIQVDEHLRTEDAHILAVGDCAVAPSKFARGRRVRLESVQNANAQARCVAAGLVTGQSALYDAVPWFWSNQGDLKVQIAGLADDCANTDVCGTVDSARFSVACFDSQGLLVAVESVNSPSDHLAARRLLAVEAPVTRAAVSDVGGDLRALAKSLRRPGGSAR